MISGLQTVLLTPLLSFVIAAACVPIARRLALRYEAVAQPAPDSRHSEPTPYFGGVVIVGAILAALAVFGSLPWWIVLGSVGLLVVGTVDDVVVLKPRQKLIAEIVVAVGVLALVPGFGFTPWVAADFAIALFWLVATSNAFNFVDGLDGLASGIGMIAGSAIAVTALLRHDLVLAEWALATAGALAGFLIYNFRPASIFMGDGGALPVGLLLGFMALGAGASSGNSRVTIYVFPILVMLVPLLDTAIVSVTRLATGRGVSRRGLDHSHHRLLSLGLSDERAVLITWGVALFAATGGVLSSVMPHPLLLATLPLLLLAAALIGLFMMDLTFDSRPPGIAYGYVPRLARFILRASYKWRLVDIALDAVLITAAYLGAFLIRLDFKITNQVVYAAFASLPLVLGASYAAFFVVGVYQGIWRYASLSDVIRFADGAALAGAVMAVLAMLGAVVASGSIVVLFSILAFNLLVASRMSFRVLRKAIQRIAAADARVLIVGAGHLAATAAQDLASTARRPRVVGFVDDDAFKKGKLVNGYPVLGSLDELEQIHRDTRFNQILIAVESLSGERLSQLWSFANERDLDVRRFSIEVNEVGMTMSNAASGLPIPRGEVRS